MNKMNENFCLASEDLIKRPLMMKKQEQQKKKKKKKKTNNKKNRSPKLISQ